MFKRRLALAAASAMIAGSAALVLATIGANAHHNLARADTTASFPFQCPSNVNQDCMRITAGSNNTGQLWTVFNPDNSLLASIGAYGGLGVFNSRLTATNALFGPGVGMDATANPPGFFYGTPGASTHMYIGQKGAPTIPCAVGDTYWRIDTPTVSKQLMYVCTSTNQWKGRI